MRDLQHRFTLLLLGSLMTGSLGCAAASRTLGFQRPAADMQQVKFEEEVPETPADPKHPNELKLAYARWMEDSGNIGEARAHYDAVTLAEPKNVDAILGLARVDLLSGRPLEAEQGFQRAIKLNPASAAAHFELARCYQAQERWTEAVQELNTALLAEPTNGKYRFQLAVALAQSGDVDDALPHFVRVVGDAEAHYNVGLILKDQGRLQDAEKQFSTALAKKPELKEAEHWLRELRSGSASGRASEHSLSNATVADPHLVQTGAAVPLSPAQLEQQRQQSAAHL